MPSCLVYLQVPATFVDRLATRYLYAGLAAWQAHLGYNVSSPLADAGSVDEDPLLDPVQLCPPGIGASPAATAAVDLWATLGVPAVADDFYGRSRQGLPRVAGALLWVNVSAQPPVSRPAGANGVPALPPLSRLSSGPCSTLPPAMGDIFVDAVTGSDLSCTANGTAPVRTLAAALALAGPGTTIHLSGTFHESVTVAVPGVRLVSGSGAVIRTGTFGQGADTVTVTASAVGASLRGLVIVGGYYHALSLRAAVNVTVANCTIRGSGEAAVLVDYGTSGARILFNSILNAGQRSPRNGDGVLLRGTNDALISDNLGSGARSSAVHVMFGSSRVSVVRNVLVNGGRGVSIGSDHAHEVLCGASLPAAPGLFVTASPPCRT